MRKWLILFFSLLSGMARADDSASENFCHDPALWERIDELHRKVPNDALVIRGYAMRKGLCALINEGKISLEQGVEIFDVEKQRMIMERTAENERKRNPRPIPIEEIEPDV